MYRIRKTCKLGTRRYASGIVLRFGPLLRKAIKSSGGSLRAFASGSGSSPGHVSNVAKGRHLPPLAKLEQWADALGIAGRERERFLLAGRLEHCPTEIRRYVERLERARGIR